MTSLTIYAGPKALAKISQEGLHSDQFDTLVGASGGPKWFVLHGLDRYLFSEFFADVQSPISTIGSSAGAWRMCCLATADPVAAIDRLAQRYSEEKYSDKPTVEEITQKARLMVEHVLGPTGAKEIVENNRFKTHVFADRCRGLSSAAGKPAQSLMLGSAAVANLVSRKTLSWFFERTVFTNGEPTYPVAWTDMRTKAVSLTEDNVVQAMMATGSIPFVLDAVKDIPGASSGLYWDGGITDYHFDFPFNNGERLVLYPHFSSTVIPGWFDKKIPWRRVHSSNFDNVVLITPSEEFTAGLPYGKIPDREDFNRLNYEDRVNYWQTVLEESRRLADDFASLVGSKERCLEVLRPFSERAR
ncbi:MAG: patatin-like phospholipase family protein [Pseudohongiellaceae bacterium]